MNFLAFLSPYRWIITLGTIGVILGGAWFWHVTKVHEAVSAQKQKDATVLQLTVQRINDATAQTQAQAQVETAQRAKAAQETIRELQTAQAAVAGRAAVLARQLRELRAAESQHSVGVPNTAPAGQSPRPDSLPGFSGTLPDRIDEETLKRLTLAEKLRQSCIKLWDQAQADRK